MVAFATVATVIASQSIISGAYSLTQQAIQLGFLPRMRVRLENPVQIPRRHRCSR
jgi:KUP system potassium uptake protein